MKTLLRNSLWLLVLTTATVPGLAQENVDELRDQIQALQDRLQQMSVRKGTNVTEIGGARARARSTLPVIRIYDLGDLFAVAPPYAATISSDINSASRSIFSDHGGSAFSGGQGGGGLGGGGGGGFFNVSPAAANMPVSRMAVSPQAGSKSGVLSNQQQMIEAIKKTISPEIWDTNGGVGTITQLGNAFIISTDAESHDQIDALLNLFRKRWGTLRTVSVRAYWLWLTKAEISALTESEGLPVEQGGANVFGLVDDKQWKQLLSVVDRPEGYRASLTCYNGQTVSAVSGDQSVAVTDIRPVLTPPDEEAKSGRVAYRLETNIIQEGAAIQVTPITNLSGKTVLLDIHSRICKRIPKEQGEGKVDAELGREASPSDIARALDRPRISQQKFSTTLRVPVNRPMLIGGMTSPGTQNQGATNLCLFVRLSVQELRNDTEQQSEPAKPEDK